MYVCTSFEWAEFLCVLGLASFCSSSVQCYYESTGSLLKYKIIFSPLIGTSLFNPSTTTKTYLLFCNNTSESPVSTINTLPINTLIYHTFACDLSLINAIDLHYCHRIFSIKKTIDKFCFSSKRTCAHLNSKKLKISYIFYCQRHIPISVIGVVLHYEQLCRAPTSGNDGIFL